MAIADGISAASYPPNCICYVKFSKSSPVSDTPRSQSLTSEEDFLRESLSTDEAASPRLIPVSRVFPRKPQYRIPMMARPSSLFVLFAVEPFNCVTTISLCRLMLRSRCFYVFIAPWPFIGVLQALYASASILRFAERPLPSDVAPTSRPHSRFRAAGLLPCLFIEPEARTFSSFFSNTVHRGIDIPFSSYFPSRPFWQKHSSSKCFGFVREGNCFIQSNETRSSRRKFQTHRASISLRQPSASSRRGPGLQRNKKPRGIRRVPAQVNYVHGRFFR